MADAVALIGTWRMVSWTREFVATGETSDAMGPNPIGYVAYHADGRMMAFVLNRDRPSLSRAGPSDDEKVRLFDTMLAYCATYTVHDDKVIHHVDAAWNPLWLGDLIRPYKLDGDQLTLKDAPSKDPATGQDVIYQIVFERVRNSN